MSSSSSSSPSPHSRNAAAANAYAASMSQQQQQQQQNAQFQQQQQPQHLTPESVASLPPPGLSAPSALVVSPQGGRYLAFCSSSTATWTTRMARPALYRPLTDGTGNAVANNSNTPHSHPAPVSTVTTASSGERTLQFIDMDELRNKHHCLSASKAPPTRPLLSLMRSPRNRSGTSTSASAVANNNNNNNNPIIPNANGASADSLEERLRRERQRLTTSGSLTQFSWTTAANPPSDIAQKSSTTNNNAPNELPFLKLLVPVRGSLYLQQGVGTSCPVECLYDKAEHDNTPALDAQLSPDGSMVAWTAHGDVYVQSTMGGGAPVRLSFGSSLSRTTTSVHRHHRRQRSTATVSNSTTAAAGTDMSQHSWCAQSMTTEHGTRDLAENDDEYDPSSNQCISHGVADFVAQEEMDRYRGFWWHPDNHGILLTRVDETKVPLFRILHPDAGNSTTSGSTTYEDHRYPFAGKENPKVRLAFLPIDRVSVLDPRLQSRGPQKSAATSKTTSSPRDGPPLRRPRRGGRRRRRRSTQELHQSIEDEDDEDDPRNRSFQSIEEDTRQDMDDTDEEADDDKDVMMLLMEDDDDETDDDEDDLLRDGEPTAQAIALQAWEEVVWLDPPREASEYLARVHWFPDGSAVAQWQNRTQTVTVWQRLVVLPQSSSSSQQQQLPILRQARTTLLIERSPVWINLHHLFHVLDHPVAPADCGGPLEPDIPPFPAAWPVPGAVSFLLASERTGYQHLYLYTYCPGINGEQAVLIRTVSSGEWMVEHIVGMDTARDTVYVTGTYDSVLERHLYALPITNRSAARSGDSPDDSRDDTTADFGSGSDSGGNGVRLGLSKVMNVLAGKSTKNRASGVGAAPNPIRLTVGAGMHSVVMDDKGQWFADTSSDLDRPTSVRIFELPQALYDWTATQKNSKPKLLATLYDAMKDDKSMVSEFLATQTTVPGSVGSRLLAHLPAPELLSFPTLDGTETLHATLYRPDPRIHGPGPYPLVCAVYGGPHVQRVNRSWSQCADMRAQRLRRLGFCVAKCDNRGSSRRGLAFEAAIQRRLGRLEVLDQVALVRQLTTRGIADARRVGVYGWSYGGYLAAMCLSRAPDVFHVAVAGAPVTSWDGYDTHYTERYMGLPADNPAGYRESAVFEHVPNIQGNLMIVHGLIDENVHFRHTARLINKLIAAGKDYELLIFPDERHSPRRLRDRIYMEQRISHFFSKHLLTVDPSVIARNGDTPQTPRNLAGHL